MGPPDNPRYSRQVRFTPIGLAGQTRIQAARVLLLGCGGLGAETANLLARAGVGFLRLVDRDVVELSNPQRQAFFDENEVKEGLPKAAAAARRIAQVNSSIQVEAVIAALLVPGVTPCLRRLQPWCSVAARRSRSTPSFPPDWTSRPRRNDYRGWAR
jgi:molybdopterin-synthase adenylyltransferase